MKKKIWIPLSGLLALLLFWFLWKLPERQPQINWITAPLETGDLEVVVSASGTLSANNTVEVGTQVSGVIEAIYADFNDQVKAGQVIAKLDIRSLKAALDQADAALLQAKVQVAQKKRAYDLAKQYNTAESPDLSVQEAEGALQQVNAQFTLAEQNYRRYEELYRDGVVSRADYEIRLSEYESLKAAREIAEAGLQRTKANVGNVDTRRAGEELEIAQANLVAMQAARDRAAINLDFAYIRAPIDGIVISRDVEVGQTVAASFQTPVLFTIANDLTKMKIEASIDEADIGLIENGQEADFTVDAYLDRTFDGMVTQIRLQPQVVSNVVTYTVIVDAANEDGKLMPGMTANLEIITARRQHVLKAPVAALNFNPPPEYAAPWKEFLTKESLAVPAKQEEQGKISRLWMLKDQLPAPKTIRTGLSDGSFTEVSAAGLHAGDEVLTGYNVSGKSARESQPASPFMPARQGQRRGN